MLMIMRSDGSSGGAILHTKIRGWVTVARTLEMATEELFTAVEAPTMEKLFILLPLAKGICKGLKMER